MYPTKEIEDKKSVSYGLRFSGQIQENRLLIKVYDHNNVHKYLGHMDEHPLIKFSKIIDLLKQGKVEVKSRDQTSLEIQIMGLININCVHVPKIENEDPNNVLQEKIKQLTKRQTYYETRIHNQQQKIQRHEKLILQISKTLNQLKGNVYEVTKSFVQELKLDTNKKIHEINLHFEDINLKFTDINTYFDENKKSLIGMQDQVNKLQQARSQITNSIKIQSETIQQIKNSIKQKNQFDQNIQKTTLSLKNDFMKISEMKSQLQKKIIQNDQMFKNIKNEYTGYKWSKTLKSKQIFINGNCIQLLNHNEYLQFALLDFTLSKMLKEKKSWAIKINNAGNEVYFGVCFQSRMSKSNFTGKNIHLEGLDHGLYAIRSDGYSYSHSSKEFNHVSNKFSFDQGDVIICQYDPITCKLKFTKNNDKELEMPISPPYNEQYHPFVAFHFQMYWNFASFNFYGERKYQSVQLIPV